MYRKKLKPLNSAIVCAAAALALVFAAWTQPGLNVNLLLVVAAAMAIMAIYYGIRYWREERR
jgi:membrane protein implicated in regulation of membrane protease activity